MKTTGNSYEQSVESCFLASRIRAWTSVRSSPWWGMGRTDSSSSPSEAETRRCLVNNTKIFKRPWGSQGKLEVICFYETVESPTAIQVRLPMSECDYL